jgi:diguanylate cyclase (GGDEF)-like protein/PAS domain S-box-containing protein
MFIWAANGILLTYLLLAPRRSWPIYLTAAFFAHALATALLHVPLQLNALYTPLDTAEALIAAALLRRRSSELPIFTSPFYLFRFCACAIVAAPAICAAIQGLAVVFLHHLPFLPAFQGLLRSDALGICVTTPACVAMFRARLRKLFREYANWLRLLPVCAICVVVFLQSELPAPVLLFPVVLLVLLRMGLGWASLLTLFVTTVGAWFTSHNIGPYANTPVSNFLGPEIRLQLFVTSMIVALYSVSVVLENLRDTERRLLHIANLHALVAENSRDVIVLEDFRGTRSLISSPQKCWTGWSREQASTVGSLETIHPDDRPRMIAAIEDLRAGGDGALIECRIGPRDGAYTWVEASLRAVRDPVTRLPTGLLSNIRDISERKYAEQQLEDAFHAVEALAVTDALTGLANRRRFDQYLAAEWRRALREHMPLAMILLDADFFKLYNDTYGHPQGDVCLKQIADSVKNASARATDLAARIGGEEFAILLPNTGMEGAWQLANRICENMRGCAIPHVASSHAVMTLSAGCAAVVPQPGQASSMLLDLADQELYAAKRAGRNCVRPLPPPAGSWDAGDADATLFMGWGS